MSEKPLQGQTAIVTGAAKRIGRAIALKLAEAGANVVVNYQTSEAEAVATAKELEGKGVKALLVQADVSRPAEAGRLAEAAKKQFGRIDILVNNAGIFFPASWSQLTEEQWDRILGVNLKAQFFCAQAVAPAMLEQKRGRIINLSSIGGLLAWPEFMHYCVSKAGVIMLTRCLARALAPHILVNSVAPGTIQFAGDAPDDSYIRRAPLQRTGTGEDIASTVLFLAAQADFITGQVFVVDGGRSLTYISTPPVSPSRGRFSARRG